MKIAKMRLSSGEETIGLLEDRHVFPLRGSSQYQTLSDILESDDPESTTRFLFDDRSDPLPLSAVRLLAPIDQQEVWAAGVTYKRSRKARMDESKDAETFYDKVYTAPRPELFLKATPHRVVGPGQHVRIRNDAKWNVPEPELALMLDSSLRLVGFTIGNDMSSRDIEGENPLYLPQAKVYDACCAVGPYVTLPSGMPKPSDIGIRMVVHRGATTAFEGATSVGELARTYDELIDFLGRDNTFPHGAVLLTGTGIVPTDEFTLRVEDVVEISIDGIGTLSNPVAQG